MIARRALHGVGDAKLGEWVEQGERGVFHLRRRLSAAEAALVGPARDIRGTEEERVRMEALFAELSPLAKALMQRNPGGG
jgi:hypothetical protein